MAKLPVSLDVVETLLFFTVISYFTSYFLSWTVFSFSYCFLLLATTSATAVILLDRLHVNSDGKAVLITGCDTGFGNAAAKVFYKMGFQVFAGVLFEDKRGALELKKLGVEVFYMDVSKDFDLDFMKQKLDSKGSKLWAVITNAGVSTFGEVEWTPLDVHEKIWSVNVLGTIRTVKTALPLIRKSKGRIITIASMLGRFGAPSRSAYSLSKWAVEGFSECVRLEMRKWGVKVITIEPGNFVAATSILEGEAIKKQSDHMWAEMSDEVRIEYGREYFDSQIETMKYFTTHGNNDTTPVVETIVKAVTASLPQTRYQVMSWREKVKCFVATHLPSIVYDLFYYW